jgi:2-oxo-4-hydroxy-4-carboxy-5-ureidoimidazoline decarboxylase
MTAGRLAIGEVNTLDRKAFVARFGGVYEHSPWVAEHAWSRRPFTDGGALAAAMQEAVRSAPRERQLALLQAHPALGARLGLSDCSRAEQAGAGIAAATDAERDELRELNARYEQRFGFPFILAVTGATLPAILESCRRRVTAAPEAEFEEALRQVFRIAGFRLADLC